MRKEDNREKYKEYDHRYYIKHRRPNSKIGKLETKISDLEAKLEESEKQNKRLYFEKEIAEKILRMSTDEQTREILALKQQLAENGKEIEKLNACVDFYKSYYISFKGKVIDELEKVKAELVKLGQDYSLNWCGIKIYNFIDDQINELKGKVEE